MTPKSSSKAQNTTAKLNKITKQFQNANGKLESITKKIDILIVIELAKFGLTRKEVAEVLEVSEKTIERMVPFEKIKQKRVKNYNAKAETDNTEEANREN